MPNSTDWAYLAGFIDGEGTLTTTRHARRDRPGYFRFNLRVAVYNTNIELLHRLQSIFGGKVLIAQRGKNWKPQGQLFWSEAQIDNILLGVRPYLLLKCRQADILLAMQKTKMPATLGRRNGISPAITLQRAIATTQLKLLNKRGNDALQVSGTS